MPAGLVATLTEGQGGTSDTLVVACTAEATYRVSLLDDQNAEPYEFSVLCQSCGTACPRLGSVMEQMHAYREIMLGAGNRVVGSDDVAETDAEGNTDATCAVVGTLDATPRAVPLSCDDPGVTCAPGAQPLAGEVAAVGMELAADISENDPTYAYQYGFVFETDGDATNDWTGIPAYPNDTFIGTDTWVQFTAAKSGPWAVGVDDISSSQQIARRPVSDARVIRDGTTLTMLVPLAELGDTPDLRITAFRHTGQYLGGEWNMDYHPLVEDPLLPLVPVE